MKIITISDVGYNHPSQANWSYGIWKIDFLDTEQKYCGSITAKENFGGEERFMAKVKELFGHEVLRVKGIYTSTGTPKITGIMSMPNIESDELMEQVKDFLKV